MIQGASQADVGILVVSAQRGEFESGLRRGGQTREHALLAKALGVSHLVVVVIKMDGPTVQWQKDRFDECVTMILPFLKSCGFVIKKEVKFIPVSGFRRANVQDEVDQTVYPWWKENYAKDEKNTAFPTLLDLLDALEIKYRNPDAPLCIPVLDVYKDRGKIAMGKVER
jgi:peptide chain release factor subunit 3